MIKTSASVIASVKSRQQGLTEQQEKELYDMMNYYAKNPLRFVKEQIHAKPTLQQEMVLKAIPKHDQIAVASGHGVGKTALESWIILWFLWTHPYAKIPVTAPTQHQLFDILWSELAMWLGKSSLQDWFRWSKTHLRHITAPEEWFAVAQTASSKNPESIQGYHANYLLVVADEASGVDDSIFEALEGAQTTDTKVFMFSNPTRLSGRFYEAFKGKDASMWKTFNFSSEESPLVKEKYLKMMEKKYGRDSDIYRIRVLGEFPEHEADTFIHISDVFKATMREGFTNGTASIGVDVGRGRDESVIVAVSGTKIIKIRRKRLKDLMQTVSMVMAMEQELLSEGYQISAVKIDDTGVGGGVTDRLRELKREGMFKSKIIPINFGAKSTSKSKIKYYANLSAEMWGHMNDLIRETLALPNNDDLIAQLTSRKYTMTNNGILLESKENMRKRGLKSPDIADALALALWQSTSSAFEYKRISKTFLIPNLPF